MSKYRIEFDKDAGRFLLLYRCDDGIDDIDGEFATRAEAKAAMRQRIDEYNTVEGAERHYQAQYAYACGYHD